MVFQASPNEPDPADASLFGGTGKDSQSQPNGLGGGPDEPANRLTFEPFEFIAPDKIPPREWAYGNFLLFGYASCLAAVDGGGKGAMAVIIALAMITGSPLLGERVYRAGPVAILSYEDKKLEWQRRIAAACMEYDLDYREVIANCRFVTKPRERVSLASMVNNKIISPDGDALIEELKAMGAVLLIIDPLNHAHRLDDGNNNAQMARVAAEADRIATESNSAVLVLHHLRKGNVGDPDDIMGATSVRATFRSNRILAKMIKQDAGSFSVSERDRWRYSRISGSKDNFAPPPDKAIWYRLASRLLGNMTERYPQGDSIQVTTRWEPPKLFDGLDLETLDSIFEAIRIGPQPDPEDPEKAPPPFFSPMRQSKKWWIGNIIADVTTKPAPAAARVVAAWIKSGVLVQDTYENDKRENAYKVTLDEAKVEALLEPLKPPAAANEATP
jgi:hypothetical protein